MKAVGVSSIMLKDVREEREENQKEKLKQGIEKGEKEKFGNEKEEMRIEKEH